VFSVPRGLTLVVAAAAGLATLAPGPALGGTEIRPRVVSDVRAGRDAMTPHRPEQRDTTVEPAIAVNPTDRANAVTTYQEGRVATGGAEDNGFATTLDGGRTWRFGQLPGLTVAVGGPWDRASDPSVAFGPEGNVYASSLVFDEGSATAPSGVAVNVSTDGGRTWSAPTYPDDQPTDNGDDKEWIVVDQSAALGHHQGRVYVVWDRPAAGVLVGYSDDQGATWSAPSTVSTRFGIGAIPLVMPNGDLGVVFESFGALDAAARARAPEAEAGFGAGAGIRMVIAVAPGAGSVATGDALSFDSPHRIGAYLGNTIRQQRGGGLPTAAVDPATGRIYVGWEDGRFRTDRVNDAVITWSNDEGATWRRVKPVNPGPRGNWVDHYNIAIAVGDDGSLRVVELVRREAPRIRNASPYVDVIYQQSLDHGKTFSAPLRIDVERRADIRFAAVADGNAFFGDYEQLAVAGSRTYVVTCRAYRMHHGERATIPATIHHQRTWVTVLRGG